jgi:hypothetical protein
MQLVGPPKPAKPLPKDLPCNAVEAPLETTAQDQESGRQTDWFEGDLALILAGLRARELREAYIATSAQPTMVWSFTSKAKVARNAACQSCAGAH